jgi:hypothetical protein
MKLNFAQVEQTLTQFDARVIPDDHPLAAKLNELFGEHTFFLDENGLNVVEPNERTRAGAPTGDGSKSCQLERCAFDQSVAPRTRGDRNRRHT